MRHMRHHYCSLAIVSLSFAGVLLGCSELQSNTALAPPGQNYQRMAAQASDAGAGVVESIEATHQESKGAAGAYVAAGGQIQRNNAVARQLYNIRVRMDDGSLQTFSEQDSTDFRVGDHVRLEDGRISRY